MLYNEGNYNWENILHNSVNHESLFSYYIGSTINIGKAFNSPMRKDNIPSFSIYKSKSGELMYKDFATGDSGDIIKFTMNYFNISRRRAVIKCLSDAFRSILSNDLLKVIPKYTYPKNDVKIGIKTISFDKEDLKYWAQFNIKESILIKYNVVAVSHVWVNEKLIWVKTNTEPIYAYLAEDRIKIYRPKSNRKAKWLSNTTKEIIFGINNIPTKGDLLIITKSLKDVMTLHSLGYNAVSPNGETTPLTTNQINVLKDRFKDIVVLLDNDQAGIDTANKYKTKYNLPIIFLPDKDKDISDYINNNGITKTREILKIMLKNERNF